MIELNFIVGILVLALGFPIGGLLARIAHDELKQGQPWFKLIIFVGIIGSIVSLIYRNDVLLFTFLFIVVVTSRSIGFKKRRKY